MRLPWHSRSTTGHPTDGAAAAPAAAGDGTPANALPVRRPEWPEVGKLRPSFRADPGIRIQGFIGDLAGSHAPEPILRPLGHARSADGPAGLVSGLTRPVIARVTSGPKDAPSPTLSLRRPAADAAALPAAAEGPGLGEMPATPSRHAPVITADLVPARSLTSAGPGDRRVVPGQMPSTRPEVRGHRRRRVDAPDHDAD